jgi:hypothetical protein
VAETKCRDLEVSFGWRKGNRRVAGGILGAEENWPSWRRHLMRFSRRFQGSESDISSNKITICWMGWAYANRDRDMVSEIGICSLRRGFSR